MDNNELQHFGVLGMRWGRRRKINGGESGNNVLKPTHQYRDTQDNLVTRYGPGKFGGPKGDNTRPTSSVKTDKAFVRSVERMSKSIPSSKLVVTKQQVDDFVKSQETTKVSSIKGGSVRVAKALLLTVGSIIAVNFIADKVLGVSGVYKRL